MAIEYVLGDATEPRGVGERVIVHICNDQGGWGAGFVLSLSAKWPGPEAEYRKWAKSGEDFSLGQVQLVEVAPKLHVANVIAQAGYASAKRPVAVSYEALREGLTRVAERLGPGVSVHMPRIGVGLGGGDWTVIEEIIEETLLARGIPVTVYDWVRGR